MEHAINTAHFDLQYKESHAESAVVRENHCHAHFEMIAVLEGNISIMLEGRHYVLAARQTMILPPLTYHTITVNKKGLYRRITALFDLEAIPAVLHARFLEKTSSPSVFYCDGLDRLKDSCIKGQSSFYAPLVESLMVPVFYACIHARKAEADNKIDGSLQEILFYIDEHLCEKLLLDDIAKYATCSKSSLCHAFQEKMNISPKQYILQKRLALADKLIRDGVPASVAAIKVGYENYSNFYRMYRKLYKTNPSKANK